MGDTPQTTRRAVTKSASLAAVALTTGLSGCLGGPLSLGEEDPQPEPRVVRADADPPIEEVFPQDEVDVSVLVHNVGVGSGPVEVSVETLVGEDRVIDSAAIELEMEAESQESVSVNFTATAGAERVEAAAEAIGE